MRRTLLLLGKATLRQKGQTALPLTRPPYEDIKGQPLLNSARVRRRQAAIPHSGCDRSPQVNAFDEGKQEQLRRDDVDLLEEKRLVTALRAAKYQQAL